MTSKAPSSFKVSMAVLSSIGSITIATLNELNSSQRPLKSSSVELISSGVELCKMFCRLTYLNNLQQATGQKTTTFIYVSEH